MEGRTHRPALAGYPVNLLVRGRRVVVVGGGRIAARKIEPLLDAGAQVEVVAPEVGRRGAGLGRRGPARAARARVPGPVISTARGSRSPPPTIPP